MDNKAKTNDVKSDEILDKNIPNDRIKLPSRVSEEALEALRKLFGDEIDNGVGPLTRHSEWDMLCSLSEVYLGEGRWMPKLNFGSGDCIGLQWALRATIQGSSGIFSAQNLKDSRFIVEYPSGRQADILMSDLLSSVRVADYKKLTYYVQKDGGNEPLKSVMGHISKTMVKWAEKCGSMYSYIITNKIIFTMDSSTALLPLEVRHDSLGAVFNTIFAPASSEVAIVPVPKSLVDELAVRAAGRIRDSALLRDMTRHAIILTNASDEVSAGAKGITATKLAFVAMTYNQRFESELCKKLRPGVLKLNSSIKDAFTVDTRSKSIFGALSSTYKVIAVSIALTLYLRRFYVMNKFFNFLTNIFFETDYNIFTSVSKNFWRFINAIDRSTGVNTKWLVNKTSALSKAFLRLVSDKILKNFNFFIYKTGRRQKFKTAITNAFKTSRMLALGHLVSSAANKIVVFGDARTMRGSIVPFEFFSKLVNYLSFPAEFLAIASEELLKRYHPMATTAIIGAEAVREKFNVWYGPTAVMHYISSTLPLHYGILLHLLWNRSVAQAGSSTLLTTSDNQDFDECVDKFAVRANEEVHKENKFRMPGKNTNQDSVVACVDRKRSIHYKAASVEGVTVRKFSSCPCNERAAIRSRVTSVYTPVNNNWVQSWSKARCMPMVCVPDFAKWVGHLPTLARSQVRAMSSISVVDRKSLQIKAFVKVEKHIAMIGTQIVKPDRVPRLIQGRSLAVKVSTGPFTHAFGKQMMMMYGPDSNFVYTSGLSAEQIGYLFEIIPKRVCHEACWHAIDCKRFDRSVGPSPLHQLYLEYEKCGAPKDCLLSFKNRHEQQSGCTRNGIRYTRHAQVNSGDGDTSAGNSRIHLVLLEACPHVYGCLVHGDDAVILTDDIEAVMSWYVLHDLVPVLAPGIDFCSSLFWPTADGIVLGPKLGRVLAKGFQSMRSFHDYEPWLRGVLLSTRNSGSFVPILRVLIEKLLLLVGKGRVFREHNYVYKSCVNSPHECSDDSFVFFENRYGIGKSDVLAMERDIMENFQIGDVLTGDVYLKIVERDILG